MIAFVAKIANIFFEYVTDIFSTFTKKSDEVINNSKEISAHTILESLPLPPPEKNLTPVLTYIQKELFEYWIRCSSSPQWLVNRCCIILDLNNGKPKKQIAREQRKRINTVRKWAKRWLKENQKLSKLEGTDIKPKDYREKVLICLRDAARSGRPIIFTAEQVVQIIGLACEIKDDSDSHISHWTWDEISWEAAARGIVKFISPSSVGRLLSEAHIKPHQSRYWLNAGPEDPEKFQKEAKTVCDLYHKAQELHSQGVFLVSTDEKTGIQAIERRHSTHPAKPCVTKTKPELREHGYDRHGTVCLTANFMVAAGEIISPTLGPTRTETDFLNHFAVFSS